MYLLIEVCENQGILKILKFMFILLDIIFTIVPIGLIVMMLIDFTKGLFKAEDYSSSKEVKNVIQRIITAVLLFSLPWLIDAFMSILDSIGFSSEYLICYNNARNGNMAYYDTVYEKEQDEKETVRTRTKAENIKRAKETKELDRLKRINVVTSSESGTANVTGTSTNSNFEGGAGTKIESEPKPLTPLYNMFNITGQDIYNTKYFTEMKDKDNGYSLGAWKDGVNVSNLSGNLTTYLNGRLIFPTTGNGYDSYDHNGIDIVTSELGVPVYAPADGKIIYSEWGHTSNKGPNETAYSVQIKLDKPISYTGLWSTGQNDAINKTDNITSIFLTHMMGIKNRISSFGSVPVKQGELVGFTGVANNTPHLHMTLYSDSSYGVHTPDIKKIYNLTSNTLKEAGK